MTLNLAVILLVAIGGCALCAALHRAIVAREVWAAAGVGAIASQIALIPLLWTRSANQATVSQAGLIATVLHLLFCGAGGLLAASALHASHAYLFWLCAFYWATLAAVTLAAVRAVKAAPVAL
jgi:hypothetical protein